MKIKTPLLSLLLALLIIFSISMEVSAAQITGDEERNITDISAVQGESPSVPEAQDGLEFDAESAYTPQKSNNAPFFIGAVIAVLMFAGVALYCNKNGNKTF